jgi:hypothetical protein
MQRILALMVAATTLANVLGQTPPATPAAGILPGGGRAEQPTAKRADEPRIGINFHGGKPDDLLAVIEKEAGDQKPNVIIHPDARNVVIPAFSLRGVTPSQIFIALNMLEPGQSAVWQPVVSDDGEIWTLMPPPRNTGIDPLTGLPTQPGQLGQFGQPVRRQRAMNKQCRVFNLTPVLDGYTVEDVTTAIKAAWELMGLEQEPTIKYHKDTKLLIVFGDPEELNIVTQVNQELSNNIRTKQAAAKASDPAKPDQPQAQPSQKK